MNNLFYFDKNQLYQTSLSSKGSYLNAMPFSHVVLDHFLPNHVLDGVLDEFPNPEGIAWKQFINPREEKLASISDDQYGFRTRHLLAQFNGSTFVVFLENLTGIKGLIPDPHFFGGGLHQIKRGGYLKIHADFNWYERLRLYRRINVLIYLNKDWKEEYGGHLELWDKKMSKCQKRVLPAFNRCVIFNTTDHAFHGHPEPLSCPDGMTRKSLALYYYTNGRPFRERSFPHSTLFKKRPNDHWKNS